jgi:AcrR family transcriptional regulator
VAAAGGTAPRRTRKSPDERRDDIISASRAVFRSAGLAEVAVTDLAEAAGVSKALLYHYFPDGRAGVFAALTAQIFDDLVLRLEFGGQLPLPPAGRIEHLFAALFAFFTERPDDFTLLFKDSLASREPGAVSVLRAARGHLAGELAALLAGSDLDPAEILAASSGAVAFALANVELSLQGQFPPETGWAVTTRFVTALLPG